MLKKLSAFGLLLTLTSAPVFAEDELPDVNVDVGLNFVSNYIFRGTDMHANRAVQKSEQYGSHTGEWAFQPTVQFNTPSGWFFNIWGSFATAGRSDVDTDYRFQTSPGGAALSTSPDPGFIRSQYAAVTLQQALTQDWRVGAVPGFYKEANGLQRADEIDLTLGHSVSTKKGNIGFGLIHYTGANANFKAGFPQTTEVYISYAPPFLTDLTISAFQDVGNNSLTAAGARQSSEFDDASYYNIAYGSGVELSEDLKLTYKVAAGYGMVNRIQGWQDVTGTVGVTFSGFSVGFNYVYRPDLRFFDLDAISSTNTNSPAWLNGNSTKGDGLVGDPSQTNGAVNAYINSQIQGIIDQGIGAGVYTYTPRQKLPRTLWFVNVGYSFSI